MDKYNCESEMFEAVERPEMPLNESFFKEKAKYEQRRFDAVYAKYTHGGASPKKNYAWFSQNWVGSEDVGYAGRIYE